MTNHVIIGNGTSKVVKETDRAICLKSADISQSTPVWFPKSALQHERNVKWANGEIVPRYSVKKWFLSKVTEEHEIVMGRAV